MLEPIRIGVIGGSGVYSMDALADVQEIVLDTPFGAPSDAYVVGTLHGQRVAFLASWTTGGPTPVSWGGSKPSGWAPLLASLRSQAWST